MARHQGQESDGNAEEGHLFLPANFSNSSPRRPFSFHSLALKTAKTVKPHVAGAWRPFSFGPQQFWI
jgi:hypothetical protein